MRLRTLTLVAYLHFLLPTTHAHDADGSSARDRHGALFPLVTWLRDAAVEIIFGRPPTKQSEVGNPGGHSFAKYSEDVVVRFNVTTLQEESALSDAASRLFLDVWAITHDYVDIRMHKDDVGSFLGLLPESLRSSQSTLIANLASLVYDTYPQTYIRNGHIDGFGRQPRLPERTLEDNIFFDDYQPLPVITRWMSLLEAMFPSLVNVSSIGPSYEGRDIPVLRVGAFQPTNNGRPRKTVVVTGGLHAREWISTTTANYVAWSFITLYGKEQLITKFLDHFDIVFIPVLNPDGVEYTWQVDRLWRKSRQNTNLRFCRGLDLDRAFGYEWDGSEARSDPCSESYGGDEPFQAVEARQLAEWAREQSRSGVEFVSLIDLHSYSQQVLFPYSYSCSAEPPNLENLQELAVGLAKAIRLSNGEAYSVMSACEGAVSSRFHKPIGLPPRIVSGGGSAIDWFYHELHARYSYQIKLRDTGSYGFLLPREHIVPTGVEVFNAMKYLGDYLLGNNGIEKSTDVDGAPEPGHGSRSGAHSVPELRRAKRTT